MLGKLVFAFPQAGVAPALPGALGGHGLLLVVAAHLGAVVDAAPVKLELCPDIKPSGNWPSLDELQQFGLVREVFILVVGNFGEG